MTCDQLDNHRTRHLGHLVTAVQVKWTLTVASEFSSIGVIASYYVINVGVVHSNKHTSLSSL